MTVSFDNQDWTQQFRIQSAVDLDFVIGQKPGLPVGMSSKSPPEFRRRVLAAAISYQFQLRSIDYTLKRYVDPQQYEEDNLSLGDETSRYLANCTSNLMEGLKNLHTGDDITFGIFGAEITLYKIPHTLDTARMLSNRGLLLEVLPILRLCLEMMSWASVAFSMDDKEKIVTLKAQNCISSMKDIYWSAGKLYGYLSKFSHWGHVIHGEFIGLDKEQTTVVNASVRYRAMGLALCLVILDALVEVVRHLYRDKSDELVVRIQECLSRDNTRRTYQTVLKITEVSDLDELWEIQSFLP